MINGMEAFRLTRDAMRPRIPPARIAHASMSAKSAANCKSSSTSLMLRIARSRTAAMNAAW